VRIRARVGLAKSRWRRAVGLREAMCILRRGTDRSNHPTDRIKRYAACRCADEEPKSRRDERGEREAWVPANREHREQQEQAAPLADQLPGRPKPMASLRGPRGLMSRLNLHTANDRSVWLSAHGISLRHRDAPIGHSAPPGEIRCFHPPTLLLGSGLAAVLSDVSQDFAEARFRA
jgi:hypothetical protein